MELIPWSDKYSVNIREIDSQHKKLVSLINQLHDKMKEGKGKEVIGQILDELVKYTSYHFSFEEALLSKHGYVETKEHALAHNNLIAQLKVYLINYSEGKSVLPIELMDFLKKWLVEHISNTDKKYSSFLISKGVN